MLDPATKVSSPIDNLTEERRARGTAASVESAKNPNRLDHPATSEMDYSADDIEFMNAMEAFKVKHNRRYPAHSEIVRVFKSLGYHKDDPTIDRPK